jgi:queuine tRNA-ribosyltransferase
MNTLGAYAVHVAREGFGSIVHAASGEIMHSRTPPMEEARSLYAGQAGLAERLADADPAPLRVWDVGLGAAANAIAAIECAEQAARRPLHVVSFENDLDPLRLALEHLDKFPYLDRPGPRELLARGHWESAGCEWRLVTGDFERTLAAAPGPPDVIFYDMFSPKTIPGPWRLGTFQNLLSACAGHATELFTYTVSTAARATLLAAGFFVAKGRSMGLKHETTIALTPAAAKNSPRELLGADWLAKWRRSAAKRPAGLPAEDGEAFDRAVAEHPQFAAPAGILP